MPLYEVTAAAPREIAGLRHDGEGSVITLTESQAKHHETVGHLAPFKAESAKPEKAKGRD